MAVYFGIAQFTDPYSPRKPAENKAEPAGRAELCHRAVQWQLLTAHSRCCWPLWEVCDVPDPVSWLLGYVAVMYPWLAALLKSSCTSCCLSPPGLFAAADPVHSTACTLGIALGKKHLASSDLGNGLHTQLHLYCGFFFYRFYHITVESEASKSEMPQRKLLLCCADSDTGRVFMWWFASSCWVSAHLGKDP